MVIRIAFWCLTVFFTVDCVAQIPEFKNLKKLPPVINSNAEESMPLLTPDQSKLFFVRSVFEGNTGGKYGGLDIWCAERTAGGWKTPTNRFSNLNDKDNNVLIGISEDGNTLYTLSSSPATKLEGIYFTKFLKNKWTKPEFVPIPGIDNEDFVGMFVAPQYDAIFISMRGGDSYGEEDLYVSLKDKSGTWSKPKNLGATINTTGFEISPFLSADKKRLYFSSNGHAGFGDADIFYCERLYNSWETWSAPVNLGNVVNSKKFDAYFSVYGDSIAYFSSNRENQLSDLYSVEMTFKLSLLAPGEQYLSKADWDAMIGRSINPVLEFKADVKELTASQRELIYYVANKISERKDIKIHIVAQEQENADVTHTRLREIYGELRQAGIESYRIKEDQQSNLIKKGSRGVIEIMLFKTNLQN